MKCIVHLTSVHARNDTRIVLKECTSIRRAGYRVVLVVADGKGNEEREGLSILDVGAPRSRAQRMTAITLRILKVARELDADLYHFHDPELIPIALRLRALGKVVIYDMHEDVTKDILSKDWISPVVAGAVSKVFGVLERFAIRRFSAVVIAWPFSRERFVSLNPATVGVANYALPDELHLAEGAVTRTNEICYIGMISPIRGIYELLEALERCDTRLNLGGNFHGADAKQRARQMPAWGKVNWLGYVSRGQAAEVMARSRIGIITFLPVPNHIHSTPNKLFEYMSAGLPVIASNFPSWREIIEQYQCGICVDPHKPDEVAAAISRLLENPEESSRMGCNGRRAVLERFNWHAEERRLLELYRRLLKEESVAEAVAAC